LLPLLVFLPLLLLLPVLRLAGLVSLPGGLLRPLCQVLWAQVPADVVRWYDPREGIVLPCTPTILLLVVCARPALSILLLRLRLLLRLLCLRVLVGIPPRVGVPVRRHRPAAAATVLPVRVCEDWDAG
jgi:hypothetical protein